MNGMVECPECKGSGEIKMKSMNPLDVYGEGPVVLEKRACPQCGGSGRISRLQLSIYKARDGPAPQNIQKGFA